MLQFKWGNENFHWFFMRWWCMNQNKENIVKGHAKPKLTPKNNYHGRKLNHYGTISFHIKWILLNIRFNFLVESIIKIFNNINRRLFDIIIFALLLPLPPLLCEACVFPQPKIFLSKKEKLLPIQRHFEFFLYFWLVFWWHIKCNEICWWNNWLVCAFYGKF